MALPSLTLRNVKGSALTFTEMDTNLSNLQMANIVVAVTGGTTSNINLNSTLTFTPGSGITLSQSSGNITVAVGTQSSLSVTGTATVGNLQAATIGNITTVATLSGSSLVGGYTIGYLEMPQRASGNITLALTDSGKHVYASSGAATTITIPANSSVAFPIGTVISVVNQNTSNISISQGSAALYLAGNATAASRTITTYGMATLLKVNTDTWFINGTGVV